MTDVYAHCHGIQGKQLQDLFTTGINIVFSVPAVNERPKSTDLLKAQKEPFKLGTGTRAPHTMMLYDAAGVVELIKVDELQAFFTTVNGISTRGWLGFIKERGLEGTLIRDIWSAGTFVSAVYSRLMIEEIMTGNFVRQPQYAVLPA